MLPKIEPPDCPGVEVALANRPPAGFAAFPKRPPAGVCPELGVSFVLGVCDPLPNSEGA